MTTNKQALAALIAIALLIFTVIKIAPRVSGWEDFKGSEIKERNDATN